MTRPAAPLLYFAVALTAAATMALELSLSRVLSVVFTRDVALLAMTVALLAFGLGGWVSRRFSGEKVLGLLSLLSAALAVTTLWAVVSNGPVWLVCIVAAGPFLAAGMSLAITVSGRGCCFILLGAAGGLLAVVGLLHALGGPNAMIAVSAIYSGAAAIFFSLTGRRRGRIISVGAGLFFTLLVMANSGYRMIEIRYAKGRVLNEIPYTKWNSFSRVTLGAADDWIYVDAEPVSLLATQAHAAPAAKGAPGARTLIVNPGGGIEIAQALAAGSHDVTGVEVNAIIGKKIMQEKFADLTGRLYSRPGVHIYVEEGLSFIRKGRELYGVIVVRGRPLTPPEAAEYRTHLSPGGILIVPPGSAADGGDALLWALGLSLAAALATLTQKEGVRTFLPCFLTTGVGFAMVLSAVVSQFAIFLGHPTYGLTVVLLTALVFCAAGSYASLELLGEGGARLRLGLGGAAVLAAVVAMAAGTVVSLSAGQVLGTRIAITVLIVAPLGFVLGLPLPAALRMLEPRNVRRVWSVHVVGCVAGFALAKILAGHYGWTVTLLAGGGMYLLALAGAGLSSLVRRAEAAAR